MLKLQAWDNSKDVKSVKWPARLVQRMKLRRKCEMKSEDCLLKKVNVWTPALRLSWLKFTAVSKRANNSRALLEVSSNSSTMLSMPSSNCTLMMRQFSENTTKSWLMIQRMSLWRARTIPVSFYLKISSCPGSWQLLKNSSVSTYNSWFIQNLMLWSLLSNCQKRLKTAWISPKWRQNSTLHSVMLSSKRECTMRLLWQTPAPKRWLWFWTLFAKSSATGHLKESSHSDQTLSFRKSNLWAHLEALRLSVESSLRKWAFLQITPLARRRPWSKRTPMKEPLCALWCLKEPWHFLRSMLSRPNPWMMAPMDPHLLRVQKKKTRKRREMTNHLPIPPLQQVSRMMRKNRSQTYQDCHVCHRRESSSKIKTKNLLSLLTVLTCSHHTWSSLCTSTPLVPIDKTSSSRSDLKSSTFSPTIPRPSSKFNIWPRLRPSRWMKPTLRRIAASMTCPALNISCTLPNTSEQ